MTNFLDNDSWLTEKESSGSEIKFLEGEDYKLMDIGKGKNDMLIDDIEVEVIE